MNPPSPNPYLRLRSPYMTTSPVKPWQSAMRGYGFLIAVDGVFGPNTDYATKRFQSLKHLTVDGVVGPVTWGAA